MRERSRRDWWFDPYRQADEGFEVLKSPLKTSIWILWILFCVLNAFLNIKKIMVFGKNIFFFKLLYLNIKLFLQSSYWLFQTLRQYFIIIIIVSPLQSTAGHSPLQFLAISLDPRHLASSSCKPSCANRHST
jgi:hypothetical protein